jgi:hypothetical protein
MDYSSGLYRRFSKDRNSATITIIITFFIIKVKVVPVLN